ncbi:TVP38/TMEM64 family protein [Paenibacillus sp. YPG26]|uniref:TVP38/TMEM64 family protein n=1 Tax=Paenibacillus sp. YPG26 TaxID=2878915 RepID=UPI002040C8DB|nr:TVP38/TMEM64 family protein [Paenibacillus sp. YPG26]USB34637.1 TVP38/TMEM64 family protein [Paenibacillus sp. YPG26]
MRKWLAAAVYGMLFVAALLYQNELTAWFHHRPPVPAMLGMTTLLALFPVVPYKLVVGAAGYMYGAWWGGMICLIGSTAAGALVYAAVKYAYREQARIWLAKYKTLDRYTRFVDKHPFESIVLWRVIPLLPQMAVNVYAGVSTMSFRVFVLGSLIGKLPGIFVYSFLGGTLSSNPLLSLQVLIIYLLFTGAVLWGYKRMTRAK